MQLFLSIPRVARAFEFMVAAHREQEWGGLPYFVHPLQVAENVPNPTEDELVAALMHDVPEDTAFNSGDVRERFGDPVGDMVDLCTKDKSLTYQGNILRIVKSGNIGAMKVKWADNKVNMTGDKSWMAPDRRERLNAQYAESFLLLSSVLEI